MFVAVDYLTLQKIQNLTGFQICRIKKMTNTEQDDQSLIVAYFNLKQHSLLSYFSNNKMRIVISK